MATLYGRRPRREDELPEPEQTGTPQNVNPIPQQIPQPQEQMPPAGIVGGNPVPYRPQQIIGEEQIREAATTLEKYKSGKANLEHRIIEDEQWWKLRHWDVINKGHHNRSMQPEPASAWLFNAILNKHADAIDNYPTSVVLPREQSDEESAKTLSAVLPVVMEYNDFEDTYSLNWWEKLKHGTAAYGVFWNSNKENGLGDIDIKGIDLLKIFWEPGITDIQKSRNLFICDLMDTDLLEDEYPEIKGKLRGDVIKVEEYIYDDAIDTTDKTVVVDWYYKRNLNGRTILHYCKFAGNTVLYSSENDPQYMERGYYDHGKYPVVFDCLFPEKGTPVGFGYVAICKSPQLYIDKLGQNILENSLVNTKPRFFASTNTNIDIDKYSDWSEQFIPVEGEVSDVRIRPIDTPQMSGLYMDVYREKIEEMKDTASNRDINSGSAGSGVTSGAAISALQEAGNKTSRDMISGSYRAYSEMLEISIELMKQFYDETRAFRIMADNGQYEFIRMNKQMIGQQMIGMDSLGNALYREPVFDLKVKAQKRNPFSKLEENERAKELYAMGFFSPDKAQESLLALEMMDFEGIDKIKEQVRQGQTLLNLLEQQSQLIAQLTGMAAMGPSQPQQAPQRSGSAGSRNVPSDRTTSDLMRNNQQMPAYSQRLAKRAKPSADITNPNTEVRA